MARKLGVTIIGAVGAILLLSLIAPPFAEAKVGDKLGKEVESWGKALLLGVAMLVGLPALAKRDLGQSLVIGLITLVLGGFIYAGPTVVAVIKTFWKTIG